MAAKLTDDMKRVVMEQPLAFVATVCPDGTPNLSPKGNMERVRASLDKTCPKCGFTITPDLTKRVDLYRIECPKCGEKFRPNAAE